jgi:aminopeptidase N
LNWFFNEWYYSNGHPKLNINYTYDAASKTARVFIAQRQSDKPFKLPFAIDVYEGGAKKRCHVWMNNSTDTFSFVVNSKPDLINVDGDKILLCEKSDNKTLDEFIYQYNHAGLFVDRREAIVFAAKHQTNPKALDFLEKALTDKSWRIRSFVLSFLNMDNDTIKSSVENYLLNVAKNDARRTVKAQAVEMLGSYKKIEYKPLFMKALYDSSYTVAGKALEALSKIDDATAEVEAKKLSALPAKGTLKKALLAYIDESKFDSLATEFDKLPNIKKERMFLGFAGFLGRVKNTASLQKGVDMIIGFRDSIPKQFRVNTDPFINDILRGIAERKQDAALNEQSDYIKSKLPADKPRQ